MTGGYLTLDLRELKDYYGKIYKKGIFKYIRNTTKPIEIILPKFIIDKIKEYTTRPNIGNTFRINLTEFIGVTEFLINDVKIVLPIAYDDIYDEVKDVHYIGYSYVFKCTINNDDTIELGEI